MGCYFNNNISIFYKQIIIAILPLISITPIPRNNVQQNGLHDVLFVLYTEENIVLLYFCEVRVCSHFLYLVLFVCLSLVPFFVCLFGFVYLFVCLFVFVFLFFLLFGFCLFCLFMFLFFVLFVFCCRSFYISVLCFLFCLSLFYVFCAQYCLFLWIVHPELPVWFYLKFMYRYINVNVPFCTLQGYSKNVDIKFSAHDTLLCSSGTSGLVGFMSLNL